MFHTIINNEKLTAIAMPAMSTVPHDCTVKVIHLTIRTKNVNCCLIKAYSYFVVCDGVKFGAGKFMPAPIPKINQTSRITGKTTGRTIESVEIGLE